jgi:integral membrane protein
MFSFLNIFRITALLEGASYILLLFVGTPIKYFLNDPQYVKLLGMPHGLLFIGYIILAFMLRAELRWDSKQFGFILLASIIPFGTFYIDRKYLKPLKNE